MLSQPWARYPDVEDWLVFDDQTGRFLHLHQHYALVTGLKRVKHLALPWGRTLMANLRDDPASGWPIPTAEMELLILLVRIWAKMPPQRRWFGPKIPSHILRELDWLRRSSSEADLVRLLDELFPGLSPLLVLPVLKPGPLTAAEIIPIAQELNRRRAIAFLHPCQNGLQSPLINDWGLTVCAGASMEDAVAAMHLIRRQIPLRYPNIRFIVPHFGGLLPMLLNRLDGQMPQEDFAEAPSATARRFFYDTVGWGSKAALIAAVEAFGSSQLVPGSDYPILLPWESYAQTFQHIREAGLPPAVVDRILHRNAQALLGLA
jgi:hypothetical protein